SSALTVCPLRLVQLTVSPAAMFTVEGENANEFVAVTVVVAADVPVAMKITLATAATSNRNRVRIRTTSTYRTFYTEESRAGIGCYHCHSSHEWNERARILGRLRRADRRALTHGWHHRRGRTT